jgi:hypothetical protein
MSTHTYTPSAAELNTAIAGILDKVCVGVRVGVGFV